MANCNRQQLNITCGTDVVLHDRLIFDGETFDPNLSVGIAANLVSSLGKRTALDVQVVDDELLISVPWIDGTLPGCYGLEVTGSCNSKKWATYADSLIRYTKATVPGESEVTIESDSYDITQEVGYCYSNSPVTFAEVTVDDGYGTPSVDVTYEQRVLSMDFHNLKGNGITDIDVDEQVGDEAVNTVTIKTDADQEGTEFQVRNGSRGNGIASSSESLSDQDGGTNTFTITDDDGTVHEFHSKNGTKGSQGDSAVYDPSSPDTPDFVMANTTGDSTTKAMTQKAVTDAIKEQLEIVDGNEKDLAFSDDKGNVLVIFSEGHILSKNFDSRDLGRLEQFVQDALIESGNTYYGEKIILVKHKYSSSLLFTETEGGQGACCYGGYLFQFFNTNNKIDIYNMATKSKVQQITLTAVQTYHCNNANFGNEFYDSGDDFPLLYVSMENAAEHKCLVYRVTVTGGVFAVTLVQTITFPTPSDNFLYYPNSFIDCERSKMVIGGLGNNPWSSGVDNTLVYKTFPLPTLSDGDTTLDIADLEDSFTAYNYPTTQGGFIVNGKLYQVLGGTTNAKMIVVDLRGHKVVSEIDLAGDGLAIEPEGCFEHEGNFHINFVNGNIYKLKF